MKPAWGSLCLLFACSSAPVNPEGGGSTGDAMSVGSLSTPTPPNDSTGEESRPDTTSPSSSSPSSNSNSNSSGSTSGPLPPDASSSGGIDLPPTELLYECNLPGGEDCVYRRDGNLIGTFAEFGLPPLPELTHVYELMSPGGTTNSENLEPYHDRYGDTEYARSNVYARVYVFVEEGFTANPATFGQSLKFLGIGTANIKDPNTWRTQTVLKLREDAGALMLGPEGGSGPDLTPTSEAAVEIERGVWHVLELHVVNDADGPDLIEIWLDADARVDPPSAFLDEERYPDDPGGPFGFFHLNINWSGWVVPEDQAYYVTGLATAEAPIGDSLGLL